MIPKVDLTDLTIAVVDDEKTIVDLVSGLLTALGAKKVHKATSADQVLNILVDPNEKIDCIVSDHGMEPVTGLELLQKIRVGRNPAMNRNVRFLMLTAHGDVDVVKRAMALDVDAYVIKPVSMSSLETALNRAFARKRILQAGSHYASIPLAPPST